MKVSYVQMAPSALLVVWLRLQTRRMTSVMPPALPSRLVSATDRNGLSPFPLQTFFLFPVWSPGRDGCGFSLVSFGFVHHIHPYIL